MAKILLVEDSPELRSALSLRLSDLDHKVIQAANGQEGLDLFCKHRDELDLVLTDFQMPEMTGPAMIGQLKNLEITQPIILMSMDFSQNDADARAVAFGANSGFDKSSGLNILIQKIEELTLPGN